MKAGESTSSHESASCPPAVFYRDSMKTWCTLMWISWLACFQNSLMLMSISKICLRTYRLSFFEKLVICRGLKFSYIYVYIYTHTYIHVCMKDSFNIWSRFVIKVSIYCFYINVSKWRNMVSRCTIVALKFFRCFLSKLIL